jgi:hypothetical protein
MTCSCHHAMPVPGAFAKGAGRLSLDRASLRRELGGATGVRECVLPLGLLHQGHLQVGRPAPAGSPAAARQQGGGPNDVVGSDRFEER